ncbi:MAG: MmgE/PrpD family protein, partial [Deltaproteobacteria bacterium]|nr:MmgE/PrpD family protein [Deltaproteobacteria bacterium]
QNVIEAVKWLILDSVGNAIGGYVLKPGREIADFYEAMGGVEEATVLATGKKLPLLNAVYINSFLANVLDFDDAYKAVGHPGATIIPPALTVAETTGASGREIIAAVVAAYEANIRIARAVLASPERFAKAFGLSTHQIFGAVVASGYLLNLDERQMRTAFSLGGYNAPIPFANKVGLQPDQRPVSWMKNNYGWAAMGGVFGSILAKKDFVGNETFLDGDLGYWVMTGSDQCDFDMMVSGLGEEYQLLETHFKYYACCAWTHSAIECAERIMEKHPIDVEAIASIDVAGYSVMERYLLEKKPVNSYDAQFSLPYLLGITLMGHTPAKGLSEAHLTDDNVLNLAEKVTLQVSPEMDQMFNEKGLIPSRVVVKMVDGTQFQETVIEGKGSPEHPMTPDELRDKFYNITVPVIGDERAQKLFDAVMNLETISNIKQLL